MSVRISIPATARQGEIVEIKALMQHPMESGFRRGSRGERIPRDIVTEFTCAFAGDEVFRWELKPGISANPFIAFHLRVTRSGQLTFTWTDQHGVVTREVRELVIA